MKVATTHNIFEPVLCLPGLIQLFTCIFWIYMQGWAYASICHLLEEHTNEKQVPCGREHLTCRIISARELRKNLWPRAPLCGTDLIPHILWSMSSRFFIDFTDGTLATLLIQSNHIRMSSCLSEKTDCGRCMRMSMVQACIGSISNV